MTLQESIDFAIRNNPAVQASAKKVDAADARLFQAAGAFLPTVKLDSSYNKSYTQPSTVQITMQTTAGAVTQDITFGTNATGTIRGSSASVSQPVFVAALFPGFQIAKKGADSAREDYRKVVLDTSFNVTQAYFGVLAAGRLVKLQQESKDMAQTHLQQVNRMVAAGVSTVADKLRTEVRLANADVDLTKAKNTLEIARANFNNALGKPQETPVALEEEGFSGLLKNLPVYPDLMKVALEWRPDWKSFLLGKEISEENLRLAQVNYLPSVFLNGTLGNRVTAYPAYSTDVNSWTVTGAASWTPFDGFGTLNRIREAEASLAAQKASEDQVRNGIALEVKNAYLNVISILESISSNKKAVDSAQENFKVSNQRYLAGAGTNLELMDAQVALTQTRLNYLRALFDLEVGKAKINQVVGKEVI
jgi:outer membrane protein TolC